MAKTILYNSDATQKLKTGVDAVANAVKVTLGAKGRTVIIDNYHVPTVVTKDGVTVARNIELHDLTENVGCAMVKEAALKVLDEVGDGTTTVCVLLQAIFSEGMKLVAAGVNPMELKKGIDKAVAEVVGQLQKQAIPVDFNTGYLTEKGVMGIVGDRLLEQVATVSANNDESIGKLVAEAYSKIGKDGIITIEDARGVGTEVKVVDGMQLNEGFIDPFYINNPKFTCELKGVAVFICDKTIVTGQELINILQASRGKPLLILCNELEGEAHATLRTNRIKGNIPACAIHAPSYGEQRKELLQDIAILTGGTVISEQSGYTIDHLQYEYFGTAESIIVTKDKTTIVGGGGDPLLIKSRAEELRTYAQAKETKELDRKRLEERAAKLTGGIAVMYVGGMSQVEINEKKDRCDDAVRATKAALEEGIVAGGGQALLTCEMIDEDYMDRSDLVAGYDLIAGILSAPLRQMCDNAGVDAGFIVNECKRLERGYNVATEKFEDLVQSGIIDPVKVVRVALQQAASVAGTLLTSSVMMVEIPEKK